MPDPATHLPTVQDALEPRPCTSCGLPGAFPYNCAENSSTQDFCPRCTRNMALTEAASAQLERLLLPILEVWGMHWGQILGAEGLRGAFDYLHDDLETLTAPILERRKELEHLEQHC